MHINEDDAPGQAFEEPTGQAVHADSPEQFAYDPAVHWRQVDIPEVILVIYEFHFYNTIVKSCTDCRV